MIEFELRNKKFTACFCNQIINLELLIENKQNQL